MYELGKWLIGVCSRCNGSVYNIFAVSKAKCDNCGAEKDLRPQKVIQMDDPSD